MIAESLDFVGVSLLSVLFPVGLGIMFGVIALWPPFKILARRGKGVRRGIAFGFGVVVFGIATVFITNVTVALDSLGSAISYTYYSNIPHAQSRTPEPPGARTELALRRLLPPFERAPCYTTAEVCEWITWNNPPGGYNPRTWPGYITVYINALLCAGAATWTAWTVTRPPPQAGS